MLVVLGIFCTSALSNPAVGSDSPKPQTFLLRGELLQSNKAKIKKGDPALRKALADLVSEAAKALAKGPYSVTYKTKVPPSGDKHDYMSVGPYWWPDSSKTDGLPYIRKDGQVNPERYSIKDADYHTALCEDVHTLGLAWFFTDDKKYSDHAARLLKVWFLDPQTRMNPNLNFGQAIPGKMDGRGIGIIDTRNLGKLIDGVLLVKDSKSLPAADYKGIQDWYKAFFNWMTTSPIGLDEADEFNNHGTWYDVQVVSMALFTGQPDLAKKILNEQTKKRIESQLKEDGSQPHELARTLSWNYSQMNLIGFFVLAALAEKVDEDLFHYVSQGGKSLKSALIWMLPFAEKKKEWKTTQIKPMQPDGFIQLAQAVSGKYPDVDISHLIKSSGKNENSLLLLTNGIF
ncbi:hypothetical protein E0F88_15205 [Dyadobacter psychrotolerans]|uniref:Alginate lyase domain-containing protein n=2 Tax=Dyadobacter psychrotolerans TaxID=2541721 RepID=A0A4R5DUK4_9BACT|nr:hypothetical protein E0F88_15205 [Dyadobacter psychrotolerans]